MLWELRHSPDVAPCFAPLNHFPSGLLYGMAVYTTFRWPLADRWLVAHLKRLASNAEQWGMPLAFTAEGVQHALALEPCLAQKVLRLTVVADVQDYGDFYSSPIKPARLLLSVRQASGAGALPLALKTVDYVRPAPLIKHLGLAEIITLKQKAQLEGFDDVLLGKNNLVSEASTSNIFYIQAGSLLTPDPWRDACLPGITRQRVLETAQAQGLPLQASFPIPFSAMAAMDGAFLTNAAQGIRRVSRIDDITLPWPDAASAITDLLAASLA